MAKMVEPVTMEKVGRVMEMVDPLRAYL
jgi:hypothetical protein